MTDDAAFAGTGNAGIPVTKTENGEVVPEKSGLILGLNGMAKLQEHLAKGERRNPKDVSWREKGFEVTDKEPKREELPKFRLWALPDTFCPDCGKNDIHDNTTPGTPRAKPNPGLTAVGSMFDKDDQPELFARDMQELLSIDLRPGDLISYFQCPACVELMLREQETSADESCPVLLDQYGNDLGQQYREEELDRLMTERGERMKSRAYDWIRQAKLRGETYKER